MKIAFVSDVAFPWHIGGVERLERAEAEAVAKGNEVHFFSFRWNGMEPRFEDKGIRYHTFHKTSDSTFYRHKRRSVREAIIFSIMVWRVFRYRFDALQTNAFPFLHLPALKIYRRVTGCRLIIDVAEVWTKERWIGYMGGFLGRIADAGVRWALRGGDKYISNPDDTYHNLVLLGIPKYKIHVFTCIIDDSIIKSIQKVRGEPGLVVCLGRLIKEKRFDRWLEVVGKLSKMVRCRAVIVGEGPESENIKRMIESMRLGRVVSMRKYYKKREDAYRLVKSASALLNMSEREGLSIISLESLALGTPVVLPDYSPIPDMVKRMCVVGSEESLPSALADIIRSNDKERFIRNRHGIADFYSSSMDRFYQKMFSDLGLRNARSG